ncbi:hypothetical protein C4K46_08190 [Streptococcus oricebi]|uniref:GIY-YIG nuclease family protein n=1 Tax=Streptococcus oricebi TaxID=1547447 RepID=A0ABS5B7B9_9STRE|nr:hypothetical protein [Streptococcus oricebi]
MTDKVHFAYFIVEKDKGGAFSVGKAKKIKKWLHLKEKTAIIKSKQTFSLRVDLNWSKIIEVM